MQVLYARCAGLDVHKDSVVACARVVDDGGVVECTVQTFATTTQGLLALCDWLSHYGCTHVAMEATGVYWKPVWHVLEGHFRLVLANAAHVRNVPGRKTDVNDATWLSELLAHGLIRSSFVPPTPVQQLRDLTRTRKQLVREQGKHVQRIQKTLEDANVKLASVVSDIMGVSGRAILDAIVAGETRPEELLERTTGRLKAGRETIIEALRGQVTPHHRFLIELHLGQIDALQRAIDSVEKEAGTVLQPFRAQANLLTTIPGVSETVAQAVVSEIGVDMSRFPTVGHLVSWAGLCPRNDESAGKRRSTRVRKSGAWIKTILVQSAWAATRAKGSYLRAQFLRLKSRRGPKKAILAVAASILTAVYYMLRDGTEYSDLGSEHFDRVDQAKLAGRLVRKLETLGYSVVINKAA
jgi:transposase